MPMIAFVVHGQPKAQPRARSRVGFRGVYNPPTAKGWKELVYAAACAQRQEKPLEGPLRVDLWFYMPRPKSKSRKKDPDGPIWHIAKPDRDNLDKAVLDAITQSGLWTDDCIVCDGRISKMYHEKDGVPRVRVEITTLGTCDAC